MGKWVAGIFGTILGGALLWMLTTIVFPKVFRDSILNPPKESPAAKLIRVECSAIPPTVAPGGAAEVSVRVTRGGEPVEGASVSLKVGGGSFGLGTQASGNTYSGGVYRVTWTAPSPSASAYVFPADVILDGVRTSEGELQGHFTTSCEILVRK